MPRLPLMLLQFPQSNCRLHMWSVPPDVRVMIVVDGQVPRLEVGLATGNLASGAMAFLHAVGFWVPRCS